MESLGLEGRAVNVHFPDNKTSIEIRKMHAQARDTLFAVVSSSAVGSIGGIGDCCQRMRKTVLAVTVGSGSLTVDGRW